MWKWIVVTLSLITLAGALWSGYLEYRYQATLPRHPDPAAGNVYPLNVHGIVVYQTRDERDLLDEVLHSAVAVGLTSVLLGAIYQKKVGRTPFKPLIFDR